MPDEHPKEIYTKKHAIELGVKKEISARLNLAKTAQPMKKTEKPKQPKGKWSQN
jgi:hypothetical protein